MKSSLSKITEMTQVTKQVHISVIGENRIIVSRFEQLLWLSETNIRLQLPHKDLIIQGEHLVVKTLTAEKLEVSGTLSMIQFEGR